jgi:hypothetical protein
MVAEKVQNSSTWKPNEGDVSNPMFDPKRQIHKSWTDKERMLKCTG